MFDGRPRRANLGRTPLLSRTLYARSAAARSAPTNPRARRRARSPSRPRTGNREEEVPFRSSMVDRALTETTTTTETVVETPAAPPPRPKPRQRRPRRPGRVAASVFFGRKKPAPEFHKDGKGDPQVEHVYQPAVAVDALEEPAPRQEPGPRTVRPQSSSRNTRLLPAGLANPGKHHGDVDVVAPGTPSRHAKGEAPREEGPQSEGKGRSRRSSAARKPRSRRPSSRTPATTIPSSISKASAPCTRSAWRGRHHDPGCCPSRRRGKVAKKVKAPRRR